MKFRAIIAWVLATTILFALLSMRLKSEEFQHKKATVETTKPVAAYGKYDFTFATLDGKKVSLSDYAGKVVLVNIWAPWCGPCKIETSGFVRLYQAYKTKGFEILSVAVQTNESDVRSFVEKYKTQWPVGIYDELARNYGTYGLPDNYLFRPDGSLAKRFIGYTREEVLKPLIEEALKQVVPSKTK